MLVAVGEEAFKLTGGPGREAVVVAGSRVAGELGKVVEGVGGSQLTWWLGRVGKEGVIHKLLDPVSSGMAGGLGSLVIKEEVLVRWLLWGEVIVWLLEEEEVLLVMILLLLDLAGEVDSLQEGEGAEEKGEEGEGASGLAIGCSRLTIIVTSPRSCPGGRHQ